MEDLGFEFPLVPITNQYNNQLLLSLLHNKCLITPPHVPKKHSDIENTCSSTRRRRHLSKTTKKTNIVDSHPAVDFLPHASNSFTIDDDHVCPMYLDIWTIAHAPPSYFGFKHLSDISRNGKKNYHHMCVR